MNTLYIYALGAVLGLFYLVLFDQNIIADGTVLKLLWISMVVVLGIAIARSIVYLVINVYFKRAKPRASSDLVLLIARVIIYSFVIIIVAHYIFDADITSLMATSAVLSVVLGFALQATLGDLFSGVALEIEHPIRIGDFIRLNEIEGRVVAMTWRSITIKNLEDRLVMLPNSDFTTSPIEIHPYDVATAYEIDFCVPADVPPGKVIRICQTVMQQSILDLEHDPSPSTILRGVDAYSGSLKYQFSFFTYNMMRYEEVASDILERLWYALQREQIPMAYSWSGNMSPNINEGHISKALLNGKAQNQTSAGGFSERFTGSCYKLLTELPFLKGLQPAAIEVLSEECQYQLFTRGEEFAFTTKDIGNLYLLISGRILLPSHIMRTRKDQMLDSASGQSSGNWSAQFLETITEELTYHVGPIASVLVKNAALATRDPYALFHSLGSLIADQEARDAFLLGAPSEPSEEAFAGAIIGGQACCFANGQTSWSGEVTDQAEVLVLRRSVLRKIMIDYPESIDCFAKGIFENLVGISEVELIEKIKTFYKVD